MTEAKVVVLGAGVIGLTTAHLLSQEKGYSVTIVAKHMPGDYHIEYASPWAGADYIPTSIEGTPKQQYEKETWPHLAHLAKDLPEAGVHFETSKLYTRQEDMKDEAGSKTPMRADAWVRHVVPDFKVLPQSDLPKGVGLGISLTTVCINTAIYLPWLASQCLKRRVIIKRGIVKHISEAAALHHSGQRADLVINCTGLGSAKLGGVQDPALVPVRGQVVVVRNDAGIGMVVSGTDDSPDEVLYVMNRAAGGGTILGGCMQRGNWESQPDYDLATRIMKRCVDACPSLTGGKGIESLSIVRHGVGLRPSRESETVSGPRIERETIDGVTVVHQYGHAGFGYQSSYGSANAALRLVREALQGR